MSIDQGAKFMSGDDLLEDCTSKNFSSEVKRKNAKKIGLQFHTDLLSYFTTVADIFGSRTTRSDTCDDADFCVGKKSILRFLFFFLILIQRLPFASHRSAKYS